MKFFIKQLWCFLVFFTISFIAKSQPNITLVEYYVDTDPGFGNATPLMLGSASTNHNLVINLDISALSNGVHMVGVRTKDANGAWSHDNKWIFAKLGGSLSESVKPNLARTEYFLNTDPGFGNGISITTTGTATDGSGSFTLDLTGLNEGVNIVGVRSKDVNGAWSHDNKWIFAKLSTLTGERVTPNLIRSEYYVNTDPGFGNGTSITTTGTATDGSGSFTLDISAYPLGVSIVGVRSQDANKAWSHDNKWLFAKVPPENTPPTITRLEYYLDTDPGYGKGIPVAITNTNNLPGVVLNANITGLAAGKHKIFYRTKDVNGAWSHDNVDSFTLSPYNAAPAIVVNSVTKTTLCAKDSFNIGYQATVTYSAVIIFNVDISDASVIFT